MNELIKKLKFVNVVWLLFYCLIFSILLQNGFSYLDPDFGWHLKAGEEVALTGEVPSENLYNYTYTGNWVNHEWLSDYIVFKIYSTIGYEALVVVFALIILAALALLNRLVYKYYPQTKTYYVLMTLELIGIIASLPHFGVRIQEVAIIFVLLVLLLLESYNKSRKWQILLLLPFLLYLWSNLHASYLLGIAILGFWLGVKIVERIIAKYFKNLYFLDLTKKLNSKQLCIFALFLLASVAATLLTPYGLKLYGFLGGYQNTAYLTIISEWLPIYYFPLNYDQIFYLFLGLLVLLVLSYEAYMKRAKIELWPFLLSLLFLILSIKSRRHFPLFFISSFSLMAVYYSEIFSSIKVNSFKTLLKTATIIILLAVTVSELVTLKIVSNPFTFFSEKYPCAAVSFLKANPEYLEGSIFNNYNYGGYLIWTLPEKKIFIDGRLPQVEFAGHTFIEEYVSFFSRKENQEEKLSAYDINLVLINSSERKIKYNSLDKFILGTNSKDKEKKKNYLREHLSTSDDWEIIFQDDAAMLFFRE